VNELFGLDPDEEDAQDFAAFAGRFVDANHEKIDKLIERLASEINLAATTRDLDELIASIDPKQWTPEAHRDVLINYLGFPFWDVLTFSVASARGAGEIQEILVDRISPQDVRSLKGYGRVESLKGTGFGHFAAFLSRAYRENDYLLGRLHAIDRLIDIVCDSAGMDPGSKEIIRIKQSAFRRVLDVEQKYLTHSEELFRSLRRHVDALATD
jgi:hypothetical protein